MLTFHDRLYGRLELPEIAVTLATRCPLLLRLREVRMSNVPFLSHPSFANVDRFEHSLGVAHLAWRWCQRNAVDEETATALTLAALYHDAATPAYGHLFESFLKRWGFDHEAKLNDLLVGRELGRAGAQVFLGGSCQLPVELKKHRLYGLKMHEYLVADFAKGLGELGRLICGDIDLDNIDNVIRASTAMGIVGNEVVHPYEVIESIVLEDGQLRLRPEQLMPVVQWMRIRSKLYTRIIENEYEFRAQCALRWAIDAWCRDSAVEATDMWSVTDPVLTFRHLYGVPFSRTLIDRLRVGRAPKLLFSARVANAVPLGFDEACIRIGEELSRLISAHVYVDYYVDKRRRPTRMKVANRSGLFRDAVGLRHFSEMNTVEASSEIVIGAVVVTEAEIAHISSEPHLARGQRDSAVGEIADVISRHLLVTPTAVSRHWLGVPGDDDATSQQPLFACEVLERAGGAR